MYYDRIKYIRNDYDAQDFKFRFKREPRIKTLEQVHDLWLRSCERAYERKKPYIKIFDTIIKEIPDVNGYKKVYYSEEGKLYEYSFSYTSQFDSYGYSTSLVNFNKSKEENREEKINFILSNQKAFELGEKFNESTKLICHKQNRLRSILFEMVEEKLKALYKKSCFAPEITTVKIKDKEYYMELDKDSYGEYMKFNYKGTVSKTINL